MSKKETITLKAYKDFKPRGGPLWNPTIPHKDKKKEKEKKKCRGGKYGKFN